MRLIEDWWAVLKHAWSVRIAIFGALLNGIAVTIAIITGAMPFPPIVRLIPQKRLRRDNP